ncbi:hypothetical protein DRN73_07185 [Candidatus Pacearchaeota archaeon]|nr:MAG: hypothetical protein DRN73_07185 [Candidatus Pacearchaeota archaeon]
MIEEYHFGSITVNGKTYDQDIEVRWNGEVLPWWRKESHIFNLGDIQRALNQNPEIIIFGTGAYGVAKITEEAEKEIKLRGIKLIIDKTDEAVKTFNIIKQKSKEEGEEKKVIGLFHLTC